MRFSTSFFSLISFPLAPEYVILFILLQANISHFSPLNIYSRNIKRCEAFTIRSACYCDLPPTPISMHGPAHTEEQATIISGIAGIPPLVYGLVREKNGLTSEDNCLFNKHLKAVQ
jgi:hypothetical protein